MCTIGTVFMDNSQGSISFKQCDLIPATKFLVPEIEKGSGDILYLPFKRAGNKGCWSGVNNYGVSFVAADAYLQKTKDNKVAVTSVSEDIFTAYTQIIAAHKTAKDAAAYMSQFYLSFGEPDILLISDATSAYFIETNNGAVQCIKRDDRFFACTNHFRMLYGGVLYPSNHSSYLRLARAEAILEKTKSPFDVLDDQYFGETVFSICRVNKNTPPQEEQYYTQATSLFYTNGRFVDCAYQLNGNPRTNQYTYISDIFGGRKITDGLTLEQLKKQFTII